MELIENNNKKKIKPNNLCLKRGKTTLITLLKGKTHFNEKSE